MMRTSTGMESLPPSRSIRRSSSARRSFACTFALMSPISSRNNVPPLACSNFPCRRAAAPVNAPFSWPKSSDSTNSVGSAALVKFPGHQLFAGSRLAAYQHCRIGVGDLFDHRAHVLHRRGITEQRPALRSLDLNATTERTILAPQLDGFESVLDHQAEIVQLERF